MYKNKKTGELLTDSEFFARYQPDDFEMISEGETDTPLAEQMEDEADEVWTHIEECDDSEQEFEDNPKD